MNPELSPGPSLAGMRKRWALQQGQTLFSTLKRVCFAKEGLPLGF